MNQQNNSYFIGNCTINQQTNSHLHQKSQLSQKSHFKPFADYSQLTMSNQENNMNYSNVSKINLKSTFKLRSKTFREIVNSKRNLIISSTKNEM